MDPPTEAARDFIDAVASVTNLLSALVLHLCFILCFAPVSSKTQFTLFILSKLSAKLSSAYEYHGSSVCFMCLFLCFGSDCRGANCPTGANKAVESLISRHQRSNELILSSSATQAAASVSTCISVGTILRNIYRDSSQIPGEEDDRETEGPSSSNVSVNSSSPVHYGTSGQ